VIGDALELGAIGLVVFELDEAESAKVAEPVNVKF